MSRRWYASRRAYALLTVGVVMFIGTGGTLAAWTTSTAMSGTTILSPSVNQGATPTVSLAGTSASVSWAETTLSNGEPVTGYVVARYDAATDAPQTITAGCAGTIASTTCTEREVPNGSWRYAITPVFGEIWRGAESAKSTAVTVTNDPNPPTNSVTVSEAAGAAHLAGTTTYYRGVAAGSLRLTNAVTDVGSGPASSTTSSLAGSSPGWSHTPSTVSTPAGGPYESAPFAWAAGTTSSPTVGVTGRDIAGNTALTTLTFVNDSTTPTAGTMTYPDGFTSGRSVSVSFTTGTDAGSGIATRRLQRAVAPLTDTTCGSFGSFADVGSVDPASPHVDSGLGSACYRYRYVVTDRVGNQAIATSGDVAKVGYAGAVNATPGLLSHWRLGDSGTPSAISSDSFTDSAGTPLSNHTGDLAASWTRREGTANATISNEGRVFRSSTLGGYTTNTASLVPGTPDYSVEADLVRKSTMSGDMVGVVGRLTSPDTFYMARWEQADTSWNLMKYVGGVRSYLGFVAGQPALNAGQAYRVNLEMSGSTLNLYVDGVLKASATDTSITAAGRAGIMDGDRTLLASNPSKSNTTGIHIDNFQVTTTLRALDSKGPNHGYYVNGVTRGVTGALAGDTDTAARFDGVNDYVQMTGTTGFPTGAAVRSTELWFKTTSAARQVLFRYGSGAATQEYGLWLDPGGVTMTAWGHSSGNDKTFTMPYAVNDGAWHHIVKTLNNGVMTLYIDGAALPSQTATRNTVMDAYEFGIGAVLRPNDGNSGGYFNGSIDEVSFYTSALGQAQVTDHYQLGTEPAADVAGPTGGSVDATGLVGTGSRYSTSTTLSLALAKGTDPSGVASSGAELRRATASLTDGSCGTFGASTLVSGGTDPVSPKTDPVADNACYQYEYVVHDTMGNATTYTSPNIKVDTTAPAAPGLDFSAFTNSHWSGSGSTVFYRSTATSGSFTATAAANDDAAGIASYAFPALGTGWTSTPGTLGVNTYSWAAASPAAPGTKNVTATNNAGLVSANAPFTLTADNTTPSAGTVTYADGGTTSTTVSVSFTTGTDAGSGIGTRLLQRASAPLSGGSCGTYTAFTTVTGGTNPTAPLVDAVTAGNCYKYQYVVSDRVGNEHTATSASVVKVTPSYLDAISATPGLLSHWRLGESTTSSDTFAGTAGATLQSRNGEIAATWTKHADSTTDMVLTSSGRLRKGGTSTLGAAYYSSAVPASADYLVEADIYVASNLTNDIVGVIGRASTSASTNYVARYEQSSQTWVLYRVLNGTWTWLGSSTTQGLSAGATYRLGLDMNGSTIRLLVDGTQRVSATDTGIATAGRAGVSQGFHATAATSVTDAAGLHLDNLTVTPPLADRTGGNNGDYHNGPTLGVAGGITGDSNTAAQFDGVNDYGLVTRQIADDFSIEFWFKSTQGIGTGAQWWSGAGLVDAEVAGSFNDFGVSLRSDGRVVAGVGTPDVSVVSSSAGLNNGGWHHVVFTRKRSSGAITLYVDGVGVGTATGSTAALTSSANLSFGRLASGINAFAGSLDEISVYNTELSAATVADHYAAR